MKTNHAFIYLKHVLPSYFQAITAYADMPDSVSLSDLLWVVTELIDHTRFTGVIQFISKQLENSQQHDSDYQWALTLIETSYKNKTEIINGRLRSLEDEKKYCRALSYNVNVTKLERSASCADLKIFQNVENMLTKIRQFDYLDLDGQRYSADINQFLKIMLPLEYRVGYIRSFFKNHLIKLNKKIAETRATFYKSEETKILIAVTTDIRACLNHLISLQDLDVKLSKHLTQAKRLPHVNMFFQALGVVGKWTTTANYVDEAVQVVKKMLNLLNNHSKAIDSVYPCVNNAKPVVLAPSATP
jgi:hypothetical protein